ncbi:Rec8 like protein-domain-containing protein [Collybia nuda]|uniref:Rec8 like protein-domain-containing protein n=1 Tax=Collybia nuda TaxID=64659 RepID=A0A9P6CCL2_9AGAR|nr:Rec8 like protein-domain-containing protein [Collybia nuda]
MFFSPELLARRDSGFGLIWLAATLGSKSLHKKLPKRSILSADITRLCDLIAQPTEPMALRLSSNLMVGVARVYKVKQNILMTDVISCVTSLKKAVQDIKTTIAIDAQLQMAQSSVRPSALTLAIDPNSAFIMDFDALVANWDEYLNIGSEGNSKPDSGQFDVSIRKGRNEVNILGPRFPRAEAVRAEQHTLVEHHEHLLSASFDCSYDDNGGTVDLTSSQAGAVFGFEDNLFAFSDGLDNGALAEELERELGWDVSQTMNGGISKRVNNEVHALDLDHGSDNGLIFNGPTDLHWDGMPLSSVFNTPRHLKRKTPEPLRKENDYTTLSLQPNRTLAPEILSQDVVPANINYQTRTGVYGKKIKRTHLLLDDRTELTDAELKATRTEYLQSQSTLKQTAGLRHIEKEKGKIIEEMIWGVPDCIQAPALVSFWKKTYKVQAGARCRLLHICPRSDILQIIKKRGSGVTEEPPRKRQKTRDMFHVLASETGINLGSVHSPPFGTGNDTFIGVGMNLDGTLLHDRGDSMERFYSFEEPGQGRHATILPPLLQNFDFGVDLVGSQKSSLFPWDNAGGCSSNGTFGVHGSNRTYFTDRADMKLRESSLGRRDSSSLVPSQLESLVSGQGFSPAPIRKFSQFLDEDYMLEANTKNSTTYYSQRFDDLNIVALERNSFNFLEYTKMQLHSLPLSASNLDFDTIAPRGTSTRHVAAAAFYHCLGALAHIQIIRAVPSTLVEFNGV